MKEALLYEPRDGGKVLCTACARYCNIGPGQIGLCGIRQNIDGKLYLLVYGKVITGHIDPIEKKPVTHYMPGSKIFSIATTGCNWLCHPAGTEILLSDGRKKAVEDLLPGDVLWSYDVDGAMEIEPSVVTHVGSRFAQLWEVAYGARGTGRILLTEEHPLLTEGGWKEVRELRPGDRILKAWYQNTRRWKRQRAASIQRAKFHCKSCGSVIEGLAAWNRHRGRCYTRSDVETPHAMDPEAAAARERPSAAQARLYELLEELGIGFTRGLIISPDTRLPGPPHNYKVDAALPEGRLGIEIRGLGYVVTQEDRRGDIKREVFEANGWKILRFPASYLFDHPEEVKVLIAERLARPTMVNKRMWLEVKSVRPTDRVEQVYSLETLPDHNYVADGIVVHNCQYCLPGNARISTDRGILEIEDLWSHGFNPRSVEDGEVVDLEGVRTRTHRGGFQPIRQVYRHFYSDAMMHITPYYMSALQCTPDHRVFSARGASGGVHKVRARELKVGDYLAIPRSSGVRQNPVVDALEVLSTLPQPPYKRDVHLVEEDGQVRYTFGMARGVPRWIPLTPTFARLLGYYAAEGSFSRSAGRPNSCSAWFSFDAREVDRQEEVASLIERVTGHPPKYVTQRNRTALVTNNTPFALLLRELCGEGAANKRVPDPILASDDPTLAAAFLAGYLNGDGYVTEANAGTVLGSGSVSEMLTRGILELFLRLGTVPRYYVSKNPDTHQIEGRTVSRSDEHQARVFVQSVDIRPDFVDWTPLAPRAVETPDYLLLPVRSLEEVPYIGYVYNLAVDRDHSYVANHFAVANCQNFDISQRRKVEGKDATPQQVVDMTLQHGCQGIAYTYNQPTIFMEYAHDIGVIARQEGLINIFVSNGYDTPDTVRMMRDFLDCITVDFKGNGEPKFVRRYIGVPDPQPIFDTLLEIRDKTDVHVEITDLVVPQVGDDLEYARRLAQFVYDELGPETPIHFLRFHPDYKMMDLPQTPVETLEKHHHVAKEVGLRYVYLGNVPGHPLENTHCPGCGQVVVKRYGFDISDWRLDEENRCKRCGYKQAIVGTLQETVREFRFRPVM